MTSSSLPVPLYVPYILGYVRILLAFYGLRRADSQPVAAVAVWICSAMLDMLDGVAARALNQTSSLGIVLDIVADNVLRSCIWIAVASAPTTDAKHSYWTIVASTIICLEWTTLFATQTHAALSKTHWKEARQRDPWLIQVYFSNGFFNPIGIFGIYGHGLFAANIFAYGSMHSILYENVPFFRAWMALAFVGRAMSACVELWLIGSYCRHVVQQDRKKA